jgi:predicted DNA-binding transcriptional regulator YafY
MKADRLLSALMLLQAHGRLSTRELAERLEVSQRTAHRDMESLCCAGIPLIAWRGAQGGWELEKGWRTKVPGLDEAELRALLMAQPGALGDPRLIAAAERAFGKLMAAMPGAMQEQAASIRARVHIDPSGWRPMSEDLSALPVVQDAITRDRKLTFTYRRPDGETAARSVDPFGVVCKRTVWYLVARAPAGMRTYRISRMSGAVVLSLGFERPARFDLADYWKTSASQLEQHRQSFSATLSLSREAAASLSRWCHVTEVKRSRDRVTLQVEFESPAQARFTILGLGADVRVVAPPDLRAQIQAEIDRLIDSRQQPSAD